MNASILSTTVSSDPDSNGDVDVLLVDVTKKQAIELGFLASFFRGLKGAMPELYQMEFLAEKYGSVRGFHYADGNDVFQEAVKNKPDAAWIFPRGFQVPKKAESDLWENVRTPTVRATETGLAFEVNPKHSEVWVRTHWVPWAQVEELVNSVLEAEVA